MIEGRGGGRRGGNSTIRQVSIAYGTKRREFRQEKEEKKKRTEGA